MVEVKQRVFVCQILTTTEKGGYTPPGDEYTSDNVPTYHSSVSPLPHDAEALTTNTQMPRSMQSDPVHLKQPLQPSPEPHIAILFQRLRDLARAEPVLYRL